MNIPTFAFSGRQDIIRNLHRDFDNTNQQYARMVLQTSQTPDSVSARVVQDYRQAFQPMDTEISVSIFNDEYMTEPELLPQLPYKLHLINVDYMPTDESPLQQYTTKGYKVYHMAGTSHFPMIEKLTELNRLLEATIAEIRQEKLI